MAEDQDQRTEAATPKKRREAAAEGDVLQSKELGTGLVMLAGAAWIALAGRWTVGACEDVLGRGLSFDHHVVERFDPGRAIADLLGPVVPPLAALFAMTLAAAIGAPALLGSLGFRASAFGFKAGKLDPIAGFRRLFGLQGLIELGKGLVKILLMGAVGYGLLRGQLPTVMSLGAGTRGVTAGDLRAGLISTGHVFVIAVLVMTLALAAIAGFDVPIQMLQRARRLRMTKQEIKDEHKQTEGSPESKGAIKRRQREVLTESVRKAIREATVVLTNPTHFAVALRYRPGFDAAPVVLARGKDETAAAIRDLAGEHAVPMLSYPQLTRAIYFTARAGQLVREDLYIAVATVLAFVFNLDRAMADGVAPPQVDVPSAARFDERGQPAA